MPIKTCKNGHQFNKTSDCPTCPICEERRRPKHGLLATLAAPARRALENSGITTADQLAMYTQDDILKLHGMGKSSIPKLIAALQQAGLNFKQKSPK